MMSQKREAEVWNRVQAASMQTPNIQRKKTEDGLTAEQVLEVLEKELAAVCTYRAMASQARRRDIRRCLLQLAEEEWRHSRKLAAVYFLLTCKCPCPQRPRVCRVCCNREELRKRYHEEIGAAACYRCLAEHAGSFACLLRCLGDEEERHAGIILDLLQKCL